MSLANFLINALLRLNRRSAMALTAEHRFRRNRKFLAVDRSRVGPGIDIRPDRLAGVPVEWVVPRASAGQEPQATCVYFHGGAFVMGGLHSHRDMAAILARKAGIRMLMVDYRLAPEHPFPAALDDAMAVWRALLDRGLPNQQLLLAGDSAGGNIALATLQAMRDGRLPMPAAFFLFSPWLDLQNDSPTCRSNASRDTMLSPQLLDEAVALYAPQTARDDPRLSPLRGDLSGLPPCLIIASKNEVLQHDSQELQARLRAQGGHAEYLEWARTPHAFPVLARHLPEGRAALDKTAAFIRQQLLHSPG